MIDFHFVTTADGSKTIFNPQVGESYHSKHGALQESKHVFLKSGLQFYLQNTQENKISILEVGFGTGLNFLLTADYCWQNAISLNYEGIEAFPLSLEIIRQTGYQEYVNPDLYHRFIEVYPSSLMNAVQVTDSCKLEIAHCMLSQFSSQKQFDVLYFDAFAAIHQPEMWSQQSLETCCRFLKQGGVFVTYAITGNLKRSMKALGFEIEKAPGAPGKREMLRAIKK